jgi:DNA-directed RNA polymerase subunit N (RpoN/RPB10)
LDKETIALTQKGYCKICGWLEEHKWLREAFQKELAEGKSLRHIQTFLRALGLNCDTKTISKHLRLCENIAIKDQRKFEKMVNKAKKPFRKLGNFFKQQKTSQPIETCEHVKTSQFFDMGSEEVMVQCDSCGKILASCDPEQYRKRMQRDQRNWTLLEACKKN